MYSSSCNTVQSSTWKAGAWSGNTISELIERVEAEFAAYHEGKLGRIFKLKTAVLKLILANKGCNTFDIPHGMLKE